MTRGILIAVRARPSTIASVALVTAALALATQTFRRSPPRAPAPEVTVECVDPSAQPELSAPLVPAPEPPAANLPGPDIYALLGACVRDAKHPWPDTKIDIEQVRRWIEVEHDPAWFDASNASWWLPLSGEGEPGYPSGLYISVPVSGAPCGGSLIN